MARNAGLVQVPRIGEEGHMSNCVGCSCSFARDAGTGGRVLLSTRVSHSLRGLRNALASTGAVVTELMPGLLDVQTDDPVGVLTTARLRLSSVEAAEVRALVVGAEQGDDLLAAALTAPTLTQITARAEHADLLPLFADELNAFRSVYQPIVTLGDSNDTPAVIGYEALLRAAGPTGPVMPDELFGAAAAAGWLHVLDRVGRTTALRGAAGWLGDAQLFVNFLPTTIYRPEVCLRTTEQAAKAAGLRLDQVVFEVTESERITDVDHLADVFAYYRERGCRVALDDLGAGYSSLNLLVRLQPDVVKLDKDIVQQLPGAVSAAVVAAVVDITHSYGGQVLAECIETAEQADAARELGVDLGQGWFFGRPQERTRPISGSTDHPIARDVAQVLSASALGHSGNDAAVAITSEVQPFGLEPAGLDKLPRGDAAVEALLSRSVAVCTGGVTIVDMGVEDHPLVYVNAAFERATGYSAAEVLGRNCRFLQGHSTDPEAVRQIREAVAAGREHVSVLRNFRKDGSLWWNELRLSPVTSSTGQLTHYFGFQSDVTERVEAEQRLAHLAFHDKLTRLPNRALLMQELDRAVAQANITGQRLTLLFIDLDGFKAINDRLGHAAGDLVLTATAMRLRLSLREGDLLGRYGGDEFIAVLVDVPADHSHAIARRAADAVLDSFHSPLDLADEPVQLGVSIGVALFPEHGSGTEELVRAADHAMYAAKRAGRGRAVLAQTGSVSNGAPAVS
jgi:diguanylate cyclase (GGDEF)-like protein/PAS domain S-box-containing protein